MKNKHLSRHIVEPLEGRVVPAALLPTDSSSFVKATIGAPIELHAGQVLSTTGVPESGAYLMYVEKGNALIFTTDLNNNKIVDFNEITGIAAGDGLRLISFVDIHGDIVTNLVERTLSFPDANGNPVTQTLLSLSDSDSNASNDEPHLRGDGRVVLNKTIEKIEMRGLKTTDIDDQNADGIVDDVDLDLRQPETTNSIFGDIFAGAGFGAEDGGLIINGGHMQNFGFEGSTRIQIGSIRVGTAVSGHFFSFGATVTRDILLPSGGTVRIGDDVNGTLLPFIPARGQSGGDIIGVKAVQDSGAIDSGLLFSIDGLYAGDGGIGARGGDIRDVFLNGDDTSGYEVAAGNGGRGPSGGAGGSIFNFSDLGSNTTDIRIRSGDGGIGTTGAGGNGGNFSFETYNVNGSINIELGAGGDGFKAGGNGASLLRGIFTQPDPVGTTATNVFGTTHMPDSSSGIYTPILGTTRAVDIDLDGIGDVVFTTTGNSQIVVAFGTAGGGFRTVLDPDGLPIPDRINLRGPHNPHALVVADLNGDGVLDIASASNDPGQQSGIVVYLGQFEDTNRDGTLAVEEDRNGNGRNDFIGFSRPIYSPLPQIQTGDPDTLNAIQPYWESPTQVSHIAAGDFNGDGQPELAVVATYYIQKTSDAVTNQTTGLSDARQVLLFMDPDREVNSLTGLNEYTGQFVADFGTKREELSDPTTGATVVAPAAPRAPFIDIRGGASDSLRIHASPVTLADTHDAIFAGLIGTTGAAIVTIDYGERTFTPSPLLPRPVVIGSYDIGVVDTRTPAGIQPLVLQDFTIFDFDFDTNLSDLDGDGEVDDLDPIPEDGIVDLAILGTSVGRTFLVGSQGDGSGSGVQVSGNGAPASGDLISTASAPAGIKAGDWTGNGDVGEIFFLYVNSASTATLGEVNDFEPGPGSPSLILLSFIADNAPPVVAELDFIDSNADANGGLGLLYADPSGGEVFIAAGTAAFVVRSFRLVAGDGGDSLIGRGGAGGDIGSGGRVNSVTDPFTGAIINDFVGTVDMSRTNLVRLVAGDGGNGFSSGGTGGDISGVSLRVSSIVGSVVGRLFAGDGGRGVNGAGGEGGSLTKNSIQGGDTFTAGAGGDGRTGGAGGSVLGNQSGIYDSEIGFNTSEIVTNTLVITAGAGGNGTKRGGAGGDILNMFPIMNRLVGLGLGNVGMFAGDGGNATSGAGGNGGSVRNNSLQPNAALEGDILLQGGNGGSGKSGGAGGNVSQFILNIQAQSLGPAVLSFLAGNGGAATTGNGGNGGSVTDLDVSSRGIPAFIFPVFSSHVFNRALAGDGGDSAKGNGGHGGSVKNFKSSSDQGGAYAVAGGAGGDALKRGGHGGSLVNLEVNFGTNTTSKGLFIAGAGGAGHAFMANPNEADVAAQIKKAFGGTIGRGGNGGSIVGLRQTGSIGAHIDLIAGNGGDTTNYGTIIDKKNYVGKAGSISNVALDGDVGNINPSVPIKSYNDVSTGQTVADFVAFKLRDPAAPGGTGLSDADGNVGIVVGAAGRNKAVVLDPAGQPFIYETQPAKGAKNGSLINLLARNLMSAVAGGVDKLASIQITRGLRILNGEVGTDKDPTNVFDYLDENGVPVAIPELNGQLIDGALITQALQDATGKPTSLAGRVFIL